jgi:hypothetical protein
MFPGVDAGVSLLILYLLSAFIAKIADAFRKTQNLREKMPARTGSILIHMISTLIGVLRVKCVICKKTLSQSVSDFTSVTQLNSCK